MHAHIANSKLLNTISVHNTLKDFTCAVTVGGAGAEAAAASFRWASFSSSAFLCSSC